VSELLERTCEVFHIIVVQDGQPDVEMDVPPSLASGDYVRSAIRCGKAAIGSVETRDGDVPMCAEHYAFFTDLRAMMASYLADKRKYAWGGVTAVVTRNGGIRQLDDPGDAYRF